MQYNQYYELHNIECDNLISILNKKTANYVTKHFLTMLIKKLIKI